MAHGEYTQEGASEKSRKKVVNYTGVDELKVGYLLCYDRNRPAGVVTASDVGRAWDVEKPAAGNLNWFAGVVTERIAARAAGNSIIQIEEPAHQLVPFFTTESCTHNTTLLSVVPGSYYAGGVGEGVVIGRAFQTVDRSDTNGLVMAQLLGVGVKPLIEVATNTGAGPSPGVWDTCPWAEAQLDPTIGSSYWNDYKGSYQPLTGTSTTEVEEWIQTEVTSGLTQQTANVIHGALRVSSEAFASADDGLTVMYRDTSWVTTDTKTLWFEARVRMTDIDTTPDQFFVGLTDTITSTHPSGVVDDTKDKIGFYSHSGTTAATLEFITANTTTEAVTTVGASGLVDAAWVKLGFIQTWAASVQTVTPYVNGVVGTAHATEASVPTAGTGMGICYGACVDQTSTAATLDIDWVRIFQLR